MSTSSFYELTTDHVLEAVERSLYRRDAGCRATGSVMALNSLENRVYQMDFEDGLKVVTKFYRPNRWSLEQIREEHLYLTKLAQAEVPVVCPMVLPQGISVPDNWLEAGLREPTIAQSQEGILFAVFPMVKGRLLDELGESHLQTLGRYVARIHRVGETMGPSLRHRIDPETFGYQPLDYLLDSDFFETDALAQQYESTVEDLLALIEPMFEGQKMIRVHGDCHLGNTLWQGEAPFFLDFDDCCLAPAVQDIWMIVRGRDERAKKDRDALVRSYEQMNEFDDEELRLIEPLRALRIIHYSAWIAQRWEDPSFEKAFPDFGTARYWQDEMSELSHIFSSLSRGDT